MLAFPEMIVGACQQAKINVPNNLDDYSPDEFPHFYFMCIPQLNRPMMHGEHWENAKVIAQLSVDQMKNMTMEDCISMGIIQKI